MAGWSPALVFGVTAPARRPKLLGQSATSPTGRALGSDDPIALRTPGDGRQADRFLLQVERHRTAHWAVSSQPKVPQVERYALAGSKIHPTSCPLPPTPSSARCFTPAVVFEPLCATRRRQKCGGGRGRRTGSCKPPSAGFSCLSSGRCSPFPGLARSMVLAAFPLESRFATSFSP